MEFNSSRKFTGGPWSTGGFKKTISIKPVEYIVIDEALQAEALQLLKDHQDPMKIYMQMVMESAGVPDGPGSQKSVSVQTFDAAAYEIVVGNKEKKGDRPIVGYEPIYPSKITKLGERKDLSQTKLLESKSGKSPPKVGSNESLQDELQFTPSILHFKRFEQEIKSRTSYVSPFDKFIPHESLLPDLDPIVEAKLLASVDVDPVRGLSKEDRVKEEEKNERELQYMEFEEFQRGNANIKEKIQDNIDFWESTCFKKRFNLQSEGEIKLLEYAALCNLYMGTWGHDEDSMMLKLFYKFQYDDALKEKIKTGCFNLLDECVPSSCGVCKTVTDVDMANMPDENFFEIEDKKDYEDVVLKIREEFNRKLEKGLDFTEYIKNPDDSDLESDKFVSDSELVLCPEKKPSSKQWLRNQKKNLTERFKQADCTFGREEDLPEELDAECEGTVDKVTLKTLLPRTDLTSLQNSTLDLMKKKFLEKAADEQRGITWRPKTNYVYRIPNFNRRNRKPV